MDLRGTLNKLLVWADGFHEEILLYYCEEIIAVNGPFEFIDISEDQAFYREWKPLLEAGQTLQLYFDTKGEGRRVDIKKSLEKKGLKPPTEDELDFGWDFPVIRTVALVVNGV
jgi:hypothetical protein